MLYLYSIFSIVAMGTSLLAMDQKADNSGAQKSSTSDSTQSVLSGNPISYQMNSKLAGVKRYPNGANIVYKYADGSRSTYKKYFDSKK